MKLGQQDPCRGRKKRLEGQKETSLYICFLCWLPGLLSFWQKGRGGKRKEKRGKQENEKMKDEEEVEIEK